MIAAGARIAAIAPSHAYNPDTLNAGLATARAAGFDVTLLPGTLNPHRYFASPDTQRLENLQQALTAPGWDAVWAIRGGSGVTRLLPHLELDSLPPRPFIGFSDLTPLLEVLRRQGSPVVHGPVLHSLEATTPETREIFFETLRGRSTAPLRGRPLVPGRAVGPLVGGNLAMLACTAGTPWQCDTRGAILCLEDVGESPYRLDRALVQLAQSGQFDGIAGIALGSWRHCRVPEDATWTLDDIFYEHFGNLGVPVLADLPFGHGPDNVGLPLGRVATLDDAALSWGLPLT